MTIDSIARITYDPTVVPAAPGRVYRVGEVARFVTRFYRGFYHDPVARFALLISAVVLTYGGGAVMFWFHAVLLREGGPAIHPAVHWLLDSTAGFIGLTPAIALILPLAAHAAQARAGVYAAVGGLLFALATAPGPLLHNALIGRGTWIADRVTELVGTGRLPIPDPRTVPPLLDMALQVAAGVPTYVALTWASLVLVRAMVRMRPASV